jgi:MarR family transcriptional repressor of emrRAB
MWNRCMSDASIRNRCMTDTFIPDLKGPAYGPRARCRRVSCRGLLSRSLDGSACRMTDPFIPDLEEWLTEGEGGALRRERAANLLGAAVTAIGDRLAEILASHEKVTGECVALSSLPALPSATELRLVLGLSQAGVVRLLDRLETTGFIVRSKAFRDRRRTRLTVTEAGRRHAVHARLDRQHFLDSLVRTLTPGERSSLSNCLGRILSALATSRLSRLRICRLCDGRSCRADPWAGCPLDSPLTAT